MNENLYIPLVLLGVEVAAIVAMMVFLHWRAEKSRKEDDEKMASFMRHSHLENQKIHVENQKIIRSLEHTAKMAQKTLNENAMFLRMIFERVDKRDNPET